MTVAEISHSASHSVSLSAAEALHQPGITIPILPPCVHYAGNEKFIRKAFSLQDGAKVRFDVCCDLEDGAPRGGEAQQLALVVSLIKAQRGRGQRVGVRIHDVQGEFWAAELRTVLTEIAEDISFIALPKSRSARDVEMVIHEMSLLKAKLGLSVLPPLHVLIESISAVEHVREIARLPGLETLELGLMDLISDHQGAIPEECMRSPGQFEHQLLVRANTEIVSAALANGLVPVHSICIDFNNPEQVRADALTAHRFFGYLRKWSIHPAQIDPINEAFAPDASQLEKAAKILEAARKANWAPISFEDRLVDRASYRLYWGMLRRAEIYGARK